MEIFCRIGTRMNGRGAPVSRHARRIQVSTMALGLIFAAGLGGCRKAMDQLPGNPPIAASAAAAAKQDASAVVEQAPASAPVNTDQAKADQEKTVGTLNAAKVVEQKPVQTEVEKTAEAKGAGVADKGADLAGAGDTGQDAMLEYVEPVFPQELVNPKWKRMDPTAELWIDFENKRVVVGGRICFREGFLEMFACPAGTKEHESVVAVNSSARLVHACLLALGAEPGETVSWDPAYKPASGPVIDIEVRWIADGKEVAHNAREMVLDMITNKPMTQEWVFGGSRKFSDPVTKAEFYGGDGGEFICLSNFSTATIDIPVASSDSVEQLMFAANSENIPGLDHRVLMFLKPRIETKKDVEVPKQATATGAAGEATGDAGKSDGQF